MILLHSVRPLSYATTKVEFQAASLKNFIVGHWLWLSGRAIASDTSGLRFEYSHRQTFIENLFTVNCVEKTKIQKNGREWSPKNLFIVFS